MAQEKITEMTQFPLLVVGSAVVEFKKAYTDVIVRVQDIEGLREIVSYYTAIKELDRLLVIEDIAFLPRKADGILLKFVEESPLKIVILSTFDVVDSVLVSRFKRVIKFSKEETDSLFLSTKEGYSKVEEELSENTSKFDRLRYIGKYSPKIYFMESQMKGIRNKEKIMQILE